MSSCSGGCNADLLDEGALGGTLGAASQSLAQAADRLHGFL